MASASRGQGFLSRPESCFDPPGSPQAGDGVLKPASRYDSRDISLSFIRSVRGDYVQLSRECLRAFAACLSWLSFLMTMPPRNLMEPISYHSATL